MKIKFLFFIIILTTFLGGIRDEDNIADSSIDVIRIFRVVLLLLVFAYIIINLNFRKGVYKLKGFKIYIVFILYCLSTIIWAPRKLFLLFKVFEVIVLLLFFLYSNQKINNKNSVLFYNYFFKYTSYAVIGVLITGLFFFELGFEPLKGSILKYKLHGSIYSMNSNDLGFWSGLLLTLTVLKKNIFKNKKNIFLIFIYLLILIFSQARTFIVVSFVIISYFLIIKRSVISAVLFLLPILIGGYFYLGEIEVFLTRGDMSQINNLHGRTYYWELGYKYFQENKFFGHGFYTGHRFLSDIYPESNFASNTFDSTWVDIIVDLGLLGASILIVFIVNLLFQINKLKKGIKIEILIGLLFLIIRSLTGPSFETFSLFLIYLLLLSFITNKIKYDL